MPIKVGDRVKEFTVSTGVGGISLIGPHNGFQRFDDVLNTGDTTYYVIEENDKFEIGIGTYGSNNLERTTVLTSSNGGSKISLGGSGSVSIVYPASQAVFDDDFVYVSGKIVQTVGVSGISVSKADDLVYISAAPIQNTANYASGQAVQNQLDIIYVSGISGGGGGDVTTAQLNYVSGIAVYSSGQSISNQSSINTNVSSISTNTSNISSNVAGINYVSGIAVYASGQLYDDTYVSGIATYASGQAIENELQVVAVSGWASTTHPNISAASSSDNSGRTYIQDVLLDSYGHVTGLTTATETVVDTVYDDTYVSGISTYSSGVVIDLESEIVGVSGISAYASGQAISNQSSISTNTSNISTNTSNISTNTSRVAYASGQAIENEGDIVAVSGIAAYASGVSLSVKEADGSPNVADVRTIVVSNGTLTNDGNGQVTITTGGGGGGDVTTAELNYVSGIAVYASGNLYVDNDAYVSGIATYASGQAIANESDIASNTSSISTNTSNISTNTSNISTNTARVNYASGQAIANESDIVAVSGIATKTFTVTAADSSNYTIDGMGLNSDTDPTIYLHKGHTYYFNKQTASHPFRISTSNGGSAYQDADGNSIEISGQGVLKFEVPQDAPDKLYYYCTSHAAMNGVIYTTNNVDEVIHVSGIAAYASGQAISNQSSIGTNTSNISTNTSNISTNTARVNYASGQAIANESDIAALLTASGTATSLIASSGIASYASGQVNVVTDGTAEASKALVLDSAKSFTGVKDGRFSQFDSFVYSTGISIGNSGVLLSRNTPDVTTDTLYNVGGTLYFNGSQLASAGGASAEAQYASGQAVANESDIVAVSGIAVYASGHVHDDLYVSGIASYASGQAVSNQSSISTNASNISTNTGNISTNTARVNYASGQAISNQSNITALLSASGTATSLIASSGIASYASGQAIANESDVVAVSGIAAYASGNSSLSAGSGITIDGANKINVYGGSGNFAEVQVRDKILFPSENNTDTILIGNDGAKPSAGPRVVAIGVDVLKNTTTEDHTNGVYIGYFAGATHFGTSQGRENTAIGDSALWGRDGEYNVGVGFSTLQRSQGHHGIGIGHAALARTTGDMNIEVVTSGAFTSIIGTNDNKIHIENTIIGDTSSKLLAIGNISASDLTPDATLEIKPNATTDVGIIVQAVASHSANLQEWQNSSEEVLARVEPNGVIFSSGVTASGLLLPNHVPVSTTNTLYNEGGTLKFNGSAIGGGDVSTAQLNYVSGVAVYSSGQAIENESDIAALLSASGTATSLIASSGIASYASGQAIENEGDLVAVSGIAAYASGVSLTVKEADGSPNVSNVRTIVVSNGTLTDDGAGQVTVTTGGGGGSSLTAGSGIIVDGSDRINIHGGTGNLQELQITSDNVFVPKVIFTGSGVVDTPITLETRSSFESVSGSGSALLFQGTQGQLFSITDNLSSGVIFNVSDITGLPLIEADASGDVKLGEFGRYVGVGSGIPEYGFDVSASGRIQKGVVLSNYVPAVTTNTLYNEGGTLKFNGSAIGGGSSYDDTYVSGISTYASGQAIANESDIVAVSGIGAYASGQTISNQGNITALLSASGTATSLIASSGIASYASGQAIENETDIVATSGIANYASGQAISNQGNITALLSASGTATSLIASSGIATYASGQAIENESDIAALLTASGTATSLIASSGIATYASGQAIENEGLVAYASGNTANISFGSNAEGDLLYHNGTSFIRLPKGTDNYILKMNGNVPNWEAESAGSSLTAGSGVVVDGADKINVYGGTGNFQEIQLNSANTFTPKMVFTGSGVQDTPIRLKVLSNQPTPSTSGTALSFEGTEGQLFGITDNLSSGNIFSVNDITGLPLISADASGDVKIGEFGRYVGIGTGVPLYGFDVSSSGQLQKGVILSDYVPATTTNALYNDGGTLKFNGSAVGGGSASAEAQYASGQAISNQGNITALLSASGTATSLIASSGIASYASGQAIENESDIAALLTASGTATSLIASSGIATYASGQAVANEADIVASSGYFENEILELVGVSGIVLSSAGSTITISNTYVSGVAAYASGQAIANESDIATNTAKVNYASGQAISNQGNITALLSASGTATSLIASSGIATYASGQAIENEGLVTYASGNTANILFGSNAEGDILIHNGSKFTRLARGTDNYILKMNGNLPNWEAESAGSSLTAGSGITIGGDDKINVYGGSGHFINLEVNGAFTATTKSFLIDHPSKEGMKLQYASLEGPENGVYVRGTTDQGFITLPDYWRDLVDNDSITVTLTPVGQFQPIFVEQKNNREIRVGGVCGYYDYVVWGERKDVDRLEVEW